MAHKKFRDEIAIKAMVNLIRAGVYEPRSPTSIASLAETSYDIADAMILEKNREPYNNK